ncbi:MAG: hypothetical protein JWP35_167 [Caulobacter sp.]|nr:hypothetical protein [Caulobacter sp.]
MQRRQRLLLSAAASTAVLALSANAFAEGAGSDSGASAQPTTTIGEVLVTARKRTENLQDVPASIQAIGADQLEKLNAKSLADLNGVTPNAHIDELGNLTIRGITSSARNIGFEAGAAVYMDGVYLGRPLGNNQDLIDIDRVEVLRGPQGTLYGKNTTAGAISISTVRPGQTWRGAGEIQYGERNDWRLSAYVAGPLIADVLGIKLSVYGRKSDGYQKDLVSGGAYGNYDETGVRGELRLTQGSWDVSLRGDYRRDEGMASAEEPVAGFALGFSPGPDTVAPNVAYTLPRKGGGVSLTADDSLDGGYTFTSITAWRTLAVRQHFDDDFSPLDIVFHIFADDYSQVSQEFRLASPADRRFTWIAGAYYFHQDLKSDRPVTLSTGFPVQGVMSDQVKTKTDAYAVFANGDYHFTDAITLNVGLRYTSERKTLNFDQQGVPAIGYPFLTIDDHFTDSDVSPTAALSYKVSPQVTGYVKYSRGFKSGGWNPDITTTPHIKFDAESVTNYEAGLRTRLLDNRLGINATVYYMDYDDLQVSQFLGTFSGYVITNAGKARVQGVELDVQAQPTAWLSLGAGGAYNDAKYVDFDSGTGANYAGQQFTNVPKVSGFVTADINAPAFGGARFLAHVDYRYQTKTYFDDKRSVYPGIGPAAQDSYGLLNGNVGLGFDNGVKLEAYVVNANDERPLVERQPDALGLGIVVERRLTPREYGVRLSYRF